MNSTVMTIFNQLTGQYSGSIVALQSGSLVLAKELFNAIALLSIGLLGINRLLRKNVDLVESNLELVRWLIYLNIFYLFITEYDQFLPTVINSFQQAGAYLGGQVSGSYSVPTPASIINNGFKVALKIFSIDLKQTMLLNLGMVLISIIPVVVILYCFGMIAIELLLLQIGSQIILAAGIFFLAFIGLEWTKDYAERYVHTFFQVGIKMLFMYVLISIGFGLTNSWDTQLSNIPANLTLQYNFAIVMATFVFYMLCQKLPEQATVYFTGRFPMSFSPVPSLPALVKGSWSLEKKAGDYIHEKKTGIQGNAKAMAAARQAAIAGFAAQGKTPTDQDIRQQAIKTLGEARQKMRQEERDKELDATEGGKVAKSILDGIPAEEPKKVTESTFDI